MSAMIASEADINILVTAYAKLCGEGAALLFLDELGRDFWRANIDNVKTVYALAPPDFFAEAEHDLRAYAFEPFPARPEAVAKIAAFYDYQCCDAPWWEGSRPQKMLAIIQRAFPETTPGYGDMPWGVADGADRVKVALPEA